MDFLLTHGFSIEGITDSLRAASIGWSGTRCHMSAYGPISVFATDPMGLNPLLPPNVGPNARERFYLFDGQFSTDTSYFHPLLSRMADGLPKRIDDLIERNSGVETVNAGVFTAGRIDRNGLRLVTDSLGQYPIYYFQSGERYLISNVMRYLTMAMKVAGYDATPSLLPCLESLVFGGGLGDATQIREIRRLPHGHDIRANPGLQFYSTAATEYPSSYEALIDGTHGALTHHLAAVAGATGPESHIVADITGGSDSRLVLSLMLASPMRDEFGGRCNSRYPDPDANVAGALLAKYGLRTAEMPFIVDSDPNLWPQSLAQHGIDCSAAFAGGTRVATNQLWKVALPNLFHFDGAFGEIAGASSGLRGFDRFAELDISIEEVVDLQIAGSRPSGALDLITEAGLASARNNAIATIRALENEGISRDQLRAEFYLRTRCVERTTPAMARNQTPALNGKPMRSLSTTEPIRISFLPTSPDLRHSTSRQTDVPFCRQSTGRRDWFLFGIFSMYRMRQSTTRSGRRPARPHRWKHCQRPYRTNCRSGPLSTRLWVPQFRPVEGRSAETGMSTCCRLA